MTYNERKKIFKKLKSTALLIVIGLLCIGARRFIVPFVNQQVASANELTTLDSKVSQTQKELANLEYSINSSGKVIVDLDENKDVYVKNIGLLCDANSLSIHKMTVGDTITQENGVSVLAVELQVQGSLKEVKNFVNDMYASQMMCRIDSVSYRLDGTKFKWMWRDIDESDTVGWIDINNVDDYLLVPEDDNSDKEEKDLLGANAFMQQGTALCFLNVKFIGTGA